MKHTIGEGVVLRWAHGFRVLYEPATDQCWFELCDTRAALVATFDGVAIMYEGGFFAPDWWIVRELPGCAVYVRGIKERARRQARGIG